MRQVFTASGLLVVLTACFLGRRDNDESAVDSPTPGDPCAFDCLTLDELTGDAPNILGDWSSRVGFNLYVEDCGNDEVADPTTLYFDGAMEVGGRMPDGLYLTFSDEDEEFDGIVTPDGNAVFSGIHAHELGNMHISLGGQVYTEDRAYIEGFAFFGLDYEGDGTFECTGRAEWKATKSGN